jgi:hypothetical protein
MTSSSTIAPNGKKLKCLTVTDEFTKEGLAIDVDGRIRSPRVHGGPSQANRGPKNAGRSIYPSFREKPSLPNQ